MDRLHRLHQEKDEINVPITLSVFRDKSTISTSVWAYNQVVKRLSKMSFVSTLLCESTVRE